MSEGHRLLSSIIANQSGGSLLRLDRDMLEGNELDAYDFMVGHYRTHRVLPLAQTVQSETGVRLPVAEEPLEFYLSNVHDRYDYNVIRTHYATLREQLSGNDMAAVRSTIATMARDTRSARRDNRVVSMSEGIGMVEQRLIDTRGMGGITGVEAGWATYDEATGGYQNSDLVTIVARPGIGKTYILLKQARHAHYVQGKSVLFVTTEMGIEQIARRDVALALGLNPTRLKNNTISTYAMRRIAQYRESCLSDDAFRIFSVGMGATVGDIEALADEFGPDIIYLDGAYLLHPTVKGKMNRIERVGEVFDELKGFTISSNRPVVATMQYNRQAGKGGKDGSLENIGFTDAVGMHSSLVVSVKFGETENPKASRIMEFMKGREGEDTKIAINFKFAPVDFDERPLEEEEAATGADDNHDQAVWTA